MPCADRLSRAAAILALCAAAVVAVPAQAQGTYEAALSSARLGDTRQLVGLLNRGLDADTVDLQGNTLLILAAREGMLSTVQAILQYRPRVSQRNLAGDSALMLATLGGHEAVADALLEAGAELNHEGWNPLLYAAFEGRLRLLQKFLQRGADIDALAPNRSTALMLAARNGHIEVVRTLLAAGADTALVNDRGIDAATWARQVGNTVIADLIDAEQARRAGTVRLEIR